MKKYKVKNYKSRFWDKVEKTQTCWIWQAGLDKKGYGVFWLKGKICSAHRIAYIMKHGNTDKIVMHICDNPACVRPSHLVAGTHADNVRDKVKKNRQAKGEKNGRAKLTKEIVLDTRKRKAKGESTAALARQYNVDRATMRSALKGETWAWL